MPFGLFLPIVAGLGVLFLIFESTTETTTTRAPAKAPPAKPPAPALPGFGKPGSPLPTLPGTPGVTTDKTPGGEGETLPGTTSDEGDIIHIDVPAVPIPMIDESGKEVGGGKQSLDQIFAAAPVGSWIPDRPENWGQTPSLKSAFTVGQDVYFVMIKKDSGSAVLARLEVEKTGGNEYSGPLGEGRLVPLIPAGGSKTVGFARDYEQLKGTEKPEMGSVGAVPISFTIEKTKGT